MQLSMSIDFGLFNDAIQLNWFYSAKWYDDFLNDEVERAKGSSCEAYINVLYRILVVGTAESRDKSQSC